MNVSLSKVHILLTHTKLMLLTHPILVIVAKAWIGEKAFFFYPTSNRAFQKCLLLPHRGQCRPPDEDELVNQRSTHVNIFDDQYTPTPLLLGYGHTIPKQKSWFLTYMYLIQIIWKENNFTHIVLNYWSYFVHASWIRWSESRIYGLFRPTLQKVQV